MTKPPEGFELDAPLDASVPPEGFELDSPPDTWDYVLQAGGSVRNVVPLPARPAYDDMLATVEKPQEFESQMAASLYLASTLDLRPDYAYDMQKSLARHLFKEPLSPGQVVTRAMQHEEWINQTTAQWKSLLYWQKLEEPESWWKQRYNAWVRGWANMGSNIAQVNAAVLGNQAPGYGPQFLMPEQRAALAAQDEETARVLWQVAQSPELAAQDDGVAGKLFDFLIENLPYMMSSAAAYAVAGPAGGMVMGGSASYNSVYQRAIEEKVPEKTARSLAGAAFLISGAIESVGGPAADRLMLLATDKIKNRLLRLGTDLVIGDLIEGLEEGGQALTEESARAFYAGMDWNQALRRILADAGGGLALGGMFKTSSAVIRGLTNFSNPTQQRRTLRFLAAQGELTEKVVREIEQAVQEQQEEAQCGEAQAKAPGQKAPGGVVETGTVAETAALAGGAEKVAEGTEQPTFERPEWGPEGLAFVEEIGKPGLSVERSGHTDETAANIRNIVYRDENGKPIGTIQFWVKDDGTLEDRAWEDTGDARNQVEIFVDPQYRRKGIATAMWNYAKEQGYDFSQLKGQLYTEEGEAFAKSLNPEVTISGPSGQTTVQGGQPQAGPAQPAAAEGGAKEAWDMNKAEFFPMPAESSAIRSKEGRIYTGETHSLAYIGLVDAGDTFSDAIPDTGWVIDGRYYGDNPDNRLEPHAEVIRTAYEEGRPVRREIVEEYKGKSWADKILADMDAKAQTKKGYSSAAQSILSAVKDKELAPVDYVTRKADKQEVYNAASWLINESDGWFRLPKTQQQKVRQIQSQAQKQGAVPTPPPVVSVPEKRKPQPPAPAEIVPPARSGATVEAAGEPTRKISRAAQRVQEEAIARDLTESLGELPTYETMSMAEQARMAAEEIAKDYENAKQMAYGKIPPPAGLRPASIYRAVAVKARNEGDVETLRNLAVVYPQISLELTALGQEIKAADVGVLADPVKAMQEIQKTKQKAVSRKRKVKDVKKEQQQWARDAKQEIKKRLVHRQSWEEFVTSIRC